MGPGKAARILHKIWACPNARAKEQGVEWTERLAFSFLLYFLSF